jgi:hypothetical protein
MRSSHNFFLNNRSDLRQKEFTVLLGAADLVMIINSFVAYFLNCQMGLVLVILFLVLLPVLIIDKRGDNRGLKAVIIWWVIVILYSIALGIYVSRLLLLIGGVEVLLLTTGLIIYKVIREKRL